MKATHATSDMPGPSQSHLHPPNNIEPQVIETLQERITLPHGSAADRITEVINGETDITAASERMGYLKEVCGLDFGWGPSSIMETGLEALHVYGGLSWTASIIAMAALLRLAMLKPIIDSQVQGAKMREMQPYIAPLRERYQALMAQGNRAKAMEVGAQMKEMTKSSGVSYTRAFVPLLIQLPFGFGAFRVLRNAGQLPVPAFVTENWLWTTDLSFSDPYFITPAISAATIYFSFKQQAQGQSTMFGPQMLKVMGTVMPALSFCFMCFQPGSVQLYFMSTGIAAFATTSILRQQWFRNMVKLGPLPGPASPTSSTAVTGGSVTTSTQNAQQKLPANIQRVAPNAQIASGNQSVSEQPEQNRSIIDKVVDRAKEHVSETKKSFASVTGGAWGKKLEEQQKDQRKTAAARYELQRAQQLDRERLERNKQARGG